MNYLGYNLYTLYTQLKNISSDLTDIVVFTKYLDFLEEALSVVHLDPYPRSQKIAGSIGSKSGTSALLLFDGFYLN